MRQLLAQVQEQRRQTADQLARVKQEAVKVKEELTPRAGSLKRRSVTVDDDDGDDECMIVEVKKRKVVKQEVDVLDLT